jgi:hypothetical protein
MKKGLLLSLVASTVLFAGGDIAPVEPVAEAPAAACNDFYGHVGAGVVYQKTTAPASEVVSYGVAAVLGVSKEIFSGLTVGAELQGSITKGYNVTTSTSTATFNRANLTQLNLGYTFCNTAIRVGRFSVDMGLSPLVFTDTNYFGMKDVTFDGAMIANTDIPDTVVYGAYIYRAAVHGLSTVSANPMGSADGVAVVGFQNKSFADTTITGVGYYAITPGDYMVAGDVSSKWCDTDISVGGAYQNIGGVTAYVAGAILTQHFNSFDLTLAGTYGDMAYAKYTWKTLQAAGTGANSWAAGAKLSTNLAGYKLAAWGKYRQDASYEAGASVGKTISGIAFSTDVRYRHWNATGDNQTRVRAKAVYKF